MTKHTPHILLAENEPHTRLSLSIILRKAGFRVTAVRNGREALTRLQASCVTGETGFDLLVLDIQMPVSSGADLLDKLHTLSQSPPVMVITGYADRALVHNLQAKGCHAILHKPFEPHELEDMITDFFCKTHGLFPACGAEYGLAR
jgi:CheY-like chemotaxis protein